MTITINGKPQEFDDGISLQAVLDQLSVNRQQVAVEVNTQLVAREHHAERTVVDGDEIEIVTLVGGG